MSSKSKSHKAMPDTEWMSRLRKFASTGAWPADAGNRPVYPVSLTISCHNSKNSKRSRPKDGLF